MKIQETKEIVDFEIFSFTKTKVVVITAALASIALVAACFAIVASRLAHPGMLSCISTLSPMAIYAMLGTSFIGFSISFLISVYQGTSRKQNPNQFYYVKNLDENQVPSTELKTEHSSNPSEAQEIDVAKILEINLVKEDHEIEVLIPKTLNEYDVKNEDLSSLREALFPNTFLTLDVDKQTYTIWNDGKDVKIQNGNVEFEPQYLNVNWVAQLLPSNEIQALSINYISSVLAPKIDPYFFLFSFHQIKIQSLDEVKTFPYVLIKEENRCCLFLFNSQDAAKCCAETFKQLGFRDSQEKWQVIPESLAEKRKSMDILSRTPIIKVLRDHWYPNNDTYFYLKIESKNSYALCEYLESGKKFKSGLYSEEQKEKVEKHIHDLESKGYANGFEPLKLRDEKRNIINGTVSSLGDCLSDKSQVFVEYTVILNSGLRLMVLAYKAKENSEIKWIAFNSPAGSYFYIGKHFKDFTKLIVSQRSCAR